jgi:diguanylate cyclase (GGDEF)-like protein
MVLLILLLTQLVLACAWAIGGWRLSLSQRASRLWSASALAGAAALSLMLLRGHWPDWLACAVGDFGVVLAVLLLLRGALAFLRLDLRDRELASVAALALGVRLMIEAWPRHAETLPVLVNCAMLVWLLARSVWLCYPTLKQEFGEGVAFALVSPQLAMAGVLGLRLGMGLWSPLAAASPLQTESPFNLAVALLLLILSLVAHGMLLMMVLLRLVHKLRRLSQRDSLTGLYNRAEWMRQLQGQHRWLLRYGEGFGVLMIDIDHFKGFNDLHGHAAGDAVLETVAQVLTASAREADVLGRIGGEEFAVLLPRADAATARRAAERLRQALADTEIAWKQQPLRVTVSIGVAVADDPDETPAEVLERADRALYQAKGTGRNRSVLARLAAA